ncbi:hypothetical protein [Chitinophaga sp.]|uniref:hypothetical protein n=1 Tax=Chitinophaga sp. TaxID=1869181 RepID=UPI002F955C31
MKPLKEIFNIGFSPSFPPFYNKTTVTDRDHAGRPFPLAKAVRLSAYHQYTYRANRYYKPLSRMIRYDLL